MVVISKPYEVDFPQTRPKMGKADYVRRLRANRPLHAAESSFNECVLSIAEQLVERRPGLSTMDVVEQALHSCSHHAHPVEMSVGGKARPRLALSKGYIPEISW